MNDITMRPAHLAALKSENAFSIAGGRPPRITPDDGFTVYDEQGEPVMPRSIDLQVVMLRENGVRQYYARTKPYEPENPAPPLCFSDDRVRPSQFATEKQSDLCANCEHSKRTIPAVSNPAVLKSACENRAKVACLVIGGGRTAYLLSVPPMSLTPYEQYKRYLKTHGVDPYQVITRLTYEKKQLGFEFKDWVSEAQGAYISKVLNETDEASVLIGASARLTLIGETPPPAEPMIVDFPAQPEIVDLPTRPASVVEEPPKRRTRGPNKARVAVPLAAPSGPAPAANVANFTPRQSPSVQSEGFGMEKAEAPDDEMQRRMDEAFGRTR